jgi:hypothetical protein
MQVSLVDFTELMGSINAHHWTPSQMNTTQTPTLYFVWDTFKIIPPFMHSSPNLSLPINHSEPDDYALQMSSYERTISVHNK